MQLVVIGRDPGQCNIVLSSNYVSGYHAEIIQLDNGDMYLVDKSSNGTTVNGTRVTPGKEVRINRGDSIIFADTPLDWSSIKDVIVPDDVKRIISLGSHYVNDIVVGGSNVSRFHATIRQMANGKWYICDHSKNGTTINGSRCAKNSFYPLKKNDEIALAGMPVENPIPSGGFPTRLVAIIASVACVLALGVLAWVYRGSILQKSYTNEELCAMYEKSVVLMLCDYHFNVTCGTLDISELPDPDSWSASQRKFTRAMYTSFVVDGSNIMSYDQSNSIPYTGTGFFIGNDGYIVSNRHMACPWETDVTSFSTDLTVIAAAEDYYKAKLSKLYEMGFTAALPYISQVKVTGELDHCLIIPNGDYLDRNNAINCHVEKYSDGDDEDLAIFKIRSSKIPEEVTPVDLSRIKAVKPERGVEVLTIGFPFGQYLLDGKTKIQANVSDGTISRNDNDKTFGFTAVSYHGASGSPVFDKHANMIGVLFAGIDKVQGFTQAVRSEYLLKLMEKVGTDK